MLPPGALVCSKCHTLVNSEKLQEISNAARCLEEDKDFVRARQHWLTALPLLPPDAKQAQWIKQHTEELERSAADSQHTSASEWGKRLGPLAVIGFLLFKFKGALAAIFNLKFLASLASFAAVYWALYGWKFGIGFAASILIHEMGHYIDIRRRGLPADMPMFLPGLGAYVRWHDLGVTEETKAEISLAGPLAGLGAAAVCWLLYLQTGHGFWAALAHAGAWLNALNLVPVWALDGGQAYAALSKTNRMIILVACVALWLGLHQSTYFLVALGGTYRMFTKDAPAEGNIKITAYFLLLLAALAVVAKVTSGAH